MKSKFTIVSYEPSENRDKIKAKYPYVKVEKLKDIKGNIHGAKVFLGLYSALLLLSVSLLFSTMGDKNLIATLVGGLYTFISICGIVDGAMLLADNKLAEKQLEE